MSPNFFTKVPKSKESPTGYILLDEYAPLEILGEGGMGEVYLVRSISTGSQYAVKRAKCVSDADRNNFLAELQTWIDLPKHPNLVACRFFRTLDTQILIFADYVEGGSLKDWIDSRKLYEGGSDQVLERIFDVAIQLAWGLHCVHELGAIHQDIKPGNVLMASDCVAGSRGVKPQITDFGLTRARSIAGEDFDPNSSILVSSIRGTPAYWSPEQSQGMPITHKADIWSWGLSVLEMFTGELTWMSGIGAAEVLEQYREQDEYDDGIPIMPVDIAYLLKECFSQDPLERPTSLAYAVEKLQVIYQDWFGYQYARTLNAIDNAVSLLNGNYERRTRTGQVWANPEIFLAEALSAAGRNSSEMSSNVARHGATRVGTLVADIAIYDEAKSIFEELVRQGQSNLKQNLAIICKNKALVHETAGDMHGTIMEYDRAIDLLKISADESGNMDFVAQLVDIYVSKAHVLNKYTFDHKAAIDSYELAINALELFVNEHGQYHLEDRLASYYVSMAGAIHIFGNSKEAVKIYDKALLIEERLVNIEKRSDLEKSLAETYINKASVISSLGDDVGAVLLCDKSILIFEKLISREEAADLKNVLAHAYTLKAKYVSKMGDKLGAMALYDQALAIREKMVYRESRSELANDLAWIYSSKADIADHLGDGPKALELYDKAIAIQEKLVNQEGHKELANSMAVTYANKALFFSNQGNFSEALSLYDKAIAIQERLVNNEGRNQLSNDLACTLSNKADATREMGDNRAAMELYDRTIEIRERLVNKNMLNKLVYDLATDYAIKTEVAIVLGEFDVAFEACKKTLTIRKKLVALVNSNEHAIDLATAYTNIGSTLIAIGKGESSIEFYSKSIAIQEPLVNQYGLNDILGDLARAKGCHGLMLLNYGEDEQVDQAMEELNFSLNTLQEEFLRTGRDDLKKAADWIAYNFSEFMNAE
jgi:serine/threonine protein kinase